MASRSFTRAAAALTLAGVLAVSAPAGAEPVTLFTASDFFIPRPATATDQVGVRRELIEFSLVANGFEHLIGQECEFTVSADNGDSVHLNNYAVLATSGGVETDILGTESEPNVTTTVLEFDRILVGDTIWLYNVMEPDPDGIVGTSVEFTVTADCAAPATTTTTTIATTTTTEATTTTTSAPTTTTTIATTTTSAVLGETTSTTVAGDSTTTAPAVSGETLPFTGPPINGAGAAMAATAMMLLGAGMLLAARAD